MSAVAERLPAIVLGANEFPPSAWAAHELALGVLRASSACWRGDSGAAVFGTRLSAYWSAGVPPPPDRPPDALSPHGGGGRGICWYQIGNDVLGCVPGGDGGYLVPTAAIAGLVRCAPPYPRATSPSSPPERERERVGRDHKAHDVAWAVVQG